MENIHGSDPISLLWFLWLIHLAFNALTLREEAASSFTPWFCHEPAVTVYLTFVLSGVRSAVRAAVTWPLIVNLLIEICLNDVVLGDM